MPRRRRNVGVIAVVAALALAGCTPGPAAGPGATPEAMAVLGPAVPAGSSDVTLQVLVLDDGGTWSQTLQAQMQTEGMPFTVVDVHTAGRPPLTAALLADADGNAAHGHFSAIIAPPAGSPALSATEHKLLQDYQKAFGVRLVETAAMTALSPGAPAASVYRGPLDGAKAAVTQVGRAGAFSYLRDTITIDDPRAGAPEAVLVRKPQAVKGVTSTSLLTAAIPGTSVQSPLIHTEVQDGRERLLLAVDGDPDHRDIRLLSHGVLRWVTRDLSLSHYRSWFSVHSDDILLPDSQWNIEHRCEVGRNCPPEVSTTGPDATVRMVPEDVDALVAWQKERGVLIDMVLNGAGASQYAHTHGGSDPLAERLAQHQADLRWISHTFSHTFLGCRQILLPDDWECVEEHGQTQWTDLEVLLREFVANQRFMDKMALTHYSPTEVVTGEHSGLRKPPNQPEDNPHLAEALTRAGITWIASDASDEPWTREIGAARTVPRHPIDLDYNTPTARQVVSLYNWVHTPAAAGGSGECEAELACVEPLDLDRGFTENIIPMEADKIVDHMLGDDPRPHFIHQSNLTSERLLYPILDEALARRDALYSPSVALVNPSMTDAGQAILDRQEWAAADKATVKATVSGQRIRVTNDGTATIRVPVSLASAARLVVDESVVGPFGDAYADQRSAWVSLAPGATAHFETEQASGFLGNAVWKR